MTLVKYSMTNPTADIYISDITGQPSGYTFTFHDHRQTSPTTSHLPPTTLHTNVIGRHNILNLAGVVACALDQGVTIEHIQEVIKTIGQYQKTLHITSHDQYTLIDDTYNINQNGIKA
ncbi:hypothetical protein KAZ93_05180 [Patescibacteria group bacterium]|nr:hypothetical protein [Patescibacteria group bacterium]